MDKMMNKRSKPTVLMVVPILPPYVGGSAIYYRDLVEHLRRCIKIVILTRLYPGKRLYENKRNLHIYRVLPRLRRHATFRHQAFNFLANYFIMPLALMFLWILYRPRVVHLHSTSLSFTRIALAWTYLFHHPVILDVRDENFGRFVKRRNVRWYLALTPRIAERLKSYGIPSNRILVIPPPRPSVDKDLKSLNSTHKERSVIFAFIGFLDFAKGVDVLLQAFKKVAESSNSQLVIIGDGPAWTYCKRFIEENNLQERVKLLGALPHNEALRQMALADVVVLPSRSEALPRVIMEALMMRKPVIATAVGSVPDLVKHGINGLLIPSSRADILAKSMIRLTDDKLRRSLSKGFVGFEDISWDRVVDCLYMIYQQC